jgi:PST family polysaccharide transporter
LVPIVTVPYFARTLGIAGIGQIAVAGAVGLAASVLMDYGITLSGTRFAAKKVSDGEALSQYLSTTSILKLLIFVPLSVAILASALFVSTVAAHFWVFFWSIVSAGCLVLFPQWLFQGLLIVPASARILVSTRVLSAVSAIMLVRTPADTYIVPMTQALGGIIALVAAAMVLRRSFAIRFQKPTRADFDGLLRENWKLFTATAWGGVHTHGSIIIMGALLSPTSIGFYSIAQRISQAFVSVFNIAAQTVFPSFVRAYARQSDAVDRQTKTYVGLAAACAFLCLTALFILREPIYYFFSGERSALGIAVFSIWIFASFFTVISVSLNPIMVAMNFDGPLARVYRFTGLAFLIGAPIGSLYLDAVGVALATLIPECVMAIYCLAVVFRGARRELTSAG